MGSAGEPGPEVRACATRQCRDGAGGPRRVRRAGCDATACGFGLIEVVIAVALFMVVITPVAYLLTNSGGVTGAERARAIATALAHQAADGQAARSVAVVSGITFKTTAVSTTVCPAVGPRAAGKAAAKQVPVPVAQETVTVTWGKGQGARSVQVVRWGMAASGRSCP